MLDAITFAEPEVQRAQMVWTKCHTFLTTMLDPAVIKNWIDPIEPRGYVDNRLTLRAPSEQFVMYLEENFAREINQMVQWYLGGNDGVLLFEYLDQQQAQQEPQNAPAASPVQNPENYVCFLNKAFSFDTFYVSECNRVAHKIGQAVAENPGQAPLNLLFIHGPSGVGKTHLAQAIGQRALELHPDKRVCYVSSSKFEAQYVHDARFRERGAFIAFYQQMDILIIDDIQGLIGKEKTQQAFFEIFNHLYLLNKQIIMTSDVPPVEFKGMEERLITRIRSSLMIPLERPDLELRRLILRGRVAEIGVQLGDEVVEFIAENMPSNVRELEGTVKTLVTYSQIQERPIDVPFARTVMSQSINMERREVTMDLIQQLVSQHYNIEVAQLHSSTRRADIVLPRQVVMYLTHTLTGHSLGYIAERLGRKNHTTVLHGIKVIKDRMSIDADFRKAVNDLEHTIVNGEA